MESDKQKVKELSISRLVLWSENPRDPLPDRKIGRENDRIIRRAIEDVDKSWKLLSLLKTMGEMYDSSDLPIVVMKDGYPIVYDGNRRVILAMIKHNEKYLKLLPSSARRKLEGFDVDKKLYCDVCTEATALKLIIRKHADSGSWKPIQQGLFRMRYMGESPSILLQINSLTDGAIEKSKMLNQRFVEEEVFTRSHLESLGISIEGDSIMSAYTKDELVSILRDIFKLIEKGDSPPENDLPLESFRARSAKGVKRYAQVRRISQECTRRNMCQ